MASRGDGAADLVQAAATQGLDLRIDDRPFAEPLVIGRRRSGRQRISVAAEVVAKVLDDGHPIPLLAASLATGRGAPWSEAVERHRDVVSRRRCEAGTLATTLSGRVVLAWNRNRRSLVGLRLRWLKPGILSLHWRLLDDPAALADLPALVQNKAKGRFPGLHAAMKTLFDDLRRWQPSPECPDLPTIGPAFDLVVCAESVRQAHFPQIPALPVAWSRDPGRRALHAIRFGAYRRKPIPAITIHPRLRRAWVARLFIEHVIHHEYCHHVQALGSRSRREAMHGAGFRSLEAGFPGLAQALAWERANLTRLLAAEDGG